MSEHLTVSGLAARAGISPHAVRYYERLGLLPPAARSAAGYRRYDQRAVQRLRLVKGAQRVGLRLRQIAELLQVVDRGQCPCGHTEALLRQRLAEVDAELGRLGALRGRAGPAARPGPWGGLHGGELARLLAQAPGEACTVATAKGWWCVQAFSNQGGDGDGGVPQLRLPLR